MIAAEALAPCLRRGENVERMRSRAADIADRARSAEAIATKSKRTPRQIRVWKAAEKALGLAGGGRDAPTSRAAEERSA